MKFEKRFRLLRSRKPVARSDVGPFDRAVAQYRAYLDALQVREAAL